jgi:hypothetical protein
MRWRVVRSDETHERSAGARLTVELVPETCSFRSLRSELSPEDWNRLERVVLLRAGDCCETCGRPDDDRRLECDELWSYDDDSHVQRLERVVALWPACREVRHIDLAARLGEANRAVRHLAAVNGWTEVLGKQQIAVAYQRWETRSRHPWLLDIERLRDYGIEPPSVGSHLQTIPANDRGADAGLAVRQVLANNTMS